MACRRSEVQVLGVEALQEGGRFFELQEGARIRCGVDLPTTAIASSTPVLLGLGRPWVLDDLLELADARALPFSKSDETNSSMLARFARVRFVAYWRGRAGLGQRDRGRALRNGQVLSVELPGPGARAGAPTQLWQPARF